MRNIKNYCFFFAGLLVLSSCTKVVDLKLGNKTGELVIEGNITDINGPQTVSLSTNVPFTNDNTFPPVSGATVLITDDRNNSYPLKEQSPGTYQTLPFAGIAGRSYTMSVTVGGKNYTSTSVMPALVKLDSITSKVSEFDSKKRFITAHYKDPAGLGDQYRLILFVNDKQVKINTALNDDFNNGNYVHTDLLQDDKDIFPGDAIRVEMQCIDKQVYKYWLTLMQQKDSGPGGGVSPANPPTNISPKTLGYFSAHTSQAQSIIAR